MKSRPPIVLNRVATFVGLLYLLGAVVYRVGSRFAPLESLSPLFYSLPGALTGSALYAAWTGLRNKHQSAVGMVLGGALGVIATRLLDTQILTLIRAFFRGAPGQGQAFFGFTAYEVLCDLSAIVFLSALLLAGFVPMARDKLGRGPGDPDDRSGRER